MSDRLSFEPTHDEAARHVFVSALKGYANMSLHNKLQHIYDENIEPEYIEQTGGKPEKRTDISSKIESLDLYKYWGLITYHSQDLLFDYIGDTVRRTKDEQEAIACKLRNKPNKLGSLTLTPHVPASKPVSQIAIHRQPGGYIAQADENDVTAARLYSGTIELYRNAKGMGDDSSAGSDSIGLFTAAQVKARFPKLNPKRILDIGCGTGEQTTALKKEFPDAEVHGIDTAAALLNYAHPWAEQEECAIHFHQMDAQSMPFPDGHFDLIVSHILFHETSHKILPQIMSQCRRVLSANGVFLNLDVPYQPKITPLLCQVTNHWQTRHNGEPFWTGFALTDIPAALKQAGFDADKIFADYAMFGSGKYYVFGAGQ